ncbi:MAG: hypothetical protein E7270_00170 [Lachnospiraceae bacterium]|nr:hypothetical protein [Lachnospiraceae bacterium]
MVQSESIYIVVSRTNTKMGRLIRKFTRYDYNHISVSLNDALEPMYSFAREYYNNCLQGRFVEESLNRYGMNNMQSKLKIYEIPVDRETYIRVKSKIKQMYIARKEYPYDFVGAVVKRKRGKNQKYTCISFINEILEDVLDNEGYETQNSVKGICKELEKYFLKDLSICNENHSWGNDLYYSKKIS